MKTLTAAADTARQERYARELLVLVEIDWGGGSLTTYCDKELDGVEGKILDIGTLEAILTLDNVQTYDLKITLDDTDGTIKTRLEAENIHKKNCTVYLYFDDTDINADRIKFFAGFVTTPIDWGEGNRQVTLTVTSEIESFEVGFSPEEGQLEFVDPEAEGKAWPLAFGNVVHVPATKVTQAPKSTLLEPLSIVDPMLRIKLGMAEAAYQQEAMLFGFWNLVFNGAHLITPPAWWIFREYVKVIIHEDIMMNEIFKAHKKLTELNNAAKKNPADAVVRGQIAAQNNLIIALAIIMQRVKRRKKEIENAIELLCFAVATQKKAMLGMLDAHNRMRQLYGRYLDITQEICRQELNAKTALRVDGADSFEDGEQYDFCIKGVKFRGSMDVTGRQLNVAAGPLAQYTNVGVAPWQPDDAPCGNITDLDGLNLIWLEDDNPPDLTGQYLLVTKRGSTEPRVRHMLKVNKQEGKKVYFDLVEIDRGGTSSSGRSFSYDSVVNEVVEPAGGWVNLGGFGAVPAGALNNTLNPAVWGQPGVQLVLQVINAIPGGVNKQELKNLVLIALKLSFDHARGFVIVSPTARDVYTIIGEDVATIQETASVPLQSWFDDYFTPYEEIPLRNNWRADAGTPIYECGNEEDIYIANILPSTIKSVYAERTTEEGEQVFVPIPSRYYTKRESHNLGTYDVTALIFPRALRSIPGEGWTDTVYVTMDVSVGPNVVDVIEWLINTYTDKSPNAANFTAIRAKVAKYPTSFALFERPNVLEEIKRIAWESRLAVYIFDNEFFLQYLSEEPTEDYTLTDSEIEHQGLQLQYTDTQSLVTRLSSQYELHYGPKDENHRTPEVVLRHNVKKYGLHKRTEFFHTYNLRELVEKSATFWMIRQSDTWKKLTVRAFHPTLHLDPLNTFMVSLNQEHFASEDTKCFIERAAYDPKTQKMLFTLHTGVKVGDDTQYPFFWPALDAPVEWPTLEEQAAGAAGGHGPGEGVTGTIS